LVTKQQFKVTGKNFIIKVMVKSQKYLEDPKVFIFTMADDNLRDF